MLNILTFSKHTNSSYYNYFRFKPNETRLTEKITENPAELNNHRSDFMGEPKDVNDYLCAIRIKRIQVDDFSMGDQGKNNLKYSSFTILQ
jgi:hypothetical protein